MTSAPAATCPDLDDAERSRRAAERARRASATRHASTRRRRIDPTTCDREYSAEELEFMGVMDAYKRDSGRAFPTWSEVLGVARSIGYAKAGEAAAGASREERGVR